MTICVSVRVPEGIVLGTDSLSTVEGTRPDGQRGVLKKYDNARKLIPIGDLPIGAFVYGQANIGKKTVIDLIRDFSERNNHSAVQAVALGLSRFISNEYERVSSCPTHKQILGLYLAGYSKESTVSEEWEIRFPEHPTPHKPRPNDGFGVEWRGVTNPFMRLYRGYDPELLAFLEASGASSQGVKQIEVDNEFSTLITFDFMPLQNAVDFAAFVLRTTIGYNQFEIGDTTCGGSLQVAAINPEKGFQWVQELQLHLKEDPSGRA